MAFQMARAFSMSRKELQSLTNEQLHDVVTRAAGSLNRRISNIMYTPGTSKSAVYSIWGQGAGGRFTTKGMKEYNPETGKTEYDRAALEREYARERQFYQNPASTVKGAKERARRINDELFGGNAPEGLSDDLIKKEDEAYNAMEDIKNLGDEYYKIVIELIEFERKNDISYPERMTILQDIIDRARDYAKSMQPPMYSENDPDRPVFYTDSNSKKI